MADIPILNPPDKDVNGLCWHHQFTIPLLFDDCLSLLQKVCAIWGKVNDIIGALNDFNEEFNVWAKSVETQLKDLYAKYTALEARVTKNEQDIANIKNDLVNIKERLASCENAILQIQREIASIKVTLGEHGESIRQLQNTVNNHTSQISALTTSIDNLRNELVEVKNSIASLTATVTALEARVKKLEDLLKNLNIIPPIDIYNATDEEFKNGLWVKWWEWLKPKLAFKDSAPADRWEYSPNVIWWDTTTHLPRYFQLGRISQPLTLCKLPFVAVCKGVFSQKANLNGIITSAPQFNEAAFTAGNGFFDFPLTKAFGYTMDEIKFQTSYIPFLPEQSGLYVIDGNIAIASKNVNCGVRLQVPHDGLNAKLCVATSQLTVAACPDSVPITSSTKWDLYIYMVAENG